MKRRFIVFIGIFLFLLFLIMIIIVAFSQINKIKKIATVTPIATPTNRAQPLYIVSTQPQDMAGSIPLSQEIIISFNRFFSLNEIAFFNISPSLKYSIEVNENNLIIKHSQPFTPGVLYTYFIKYKSVDQSSKTYSFVTTGWVEEEDKFERQNYPDIFLANKTPYSTNDFSIASDYKDTPVGHFYFIVTLKGDPQTAKNAFIVYLKALQLTDTQIQGLDIEYQ